MTSTKHFDAALEMVSPAVVAEYYFGDQKLVMRCDKHDIPIEELSTCRSAPCVVCGEVVGGIDQPRGHTRWAEVDIAFVRRSPSGWISAKECLPPYRQQVLIWRSGEMEISCCCGLEGTPDRYWTHPGYDIKLDEISHWRPLPDPPEGETK